MNQQVMNVLGRRRRIPVASVNESPWQSTAAGIGSDLIVDRVIMVFTIWQSC